MFLSYYGLREQPFGVTPDPRFLYFGEVHREALASLAYGVEAGLGFASLIAEPGTGKTTLLYYLLNRYRTVARTAFIFDTQCNSREFLRNLLLELEIGTPENDSAGLLNRVQQFLALQARARKRVLLVLDEAQNLDPAVLETVRLLSNFETAGSKLLHIILSGQPQLGEKLSQPALLNIRQRITIATRLRPFAPLDVVRYVAHRLSVAGYRGEPLFTPDALGALAQLSGGVPREINRLCFNALSLGCALERRVIDAETLREVANDFDFSALLTSTPARGALDIPAAADLAKEFAVALARGQATPSTAPVSRVVATSAPQTPPQPLSATGAPAGSALRPSAGAVRRPPATGAPIRVPGAKAPLPLWKVRDEAQARQWKLIATTILLLAGIVLAIEAVPQRPAPAVLDTSHAQAGPAAPTSLAATAVPVEPSKAPESHAETTESRAETKTGGMRDAHVPHRPVKATPPPKSARKRPPKVEPVVVADEMVSLPRGPMTEAMSDAPLNSGSEVNPAAAQAANASPPSASAAAEAVTTGAVATGAVTTGVFADATSLRPVRGTQQSVTPPLLVKRVDPGPADPAALVHVTGDVVLSAAIGADGRVQAVRVLSGSPSLQQAAANAVRQWVYQPQRVNGEAQPSEVQIKIRLSR